MFECLKGGGEEGSCAFMQIAVGGTLTVPHLRGALSASHETRASPWPAASLGVHLLDEGTCAPLLTDRTFQAMEASVRFIDVIPVASGQQELVSYRPSGGLGLEALCGSGERRGPSDPGHHPRLRFSLSAYEKLCRHGVCTCPCGSLHESAVWRLQVGVGVLVALHSTFLLC